MGDAAAPHASAACVPPPPGLAPPLPCSVLPQVNELRRQRVTLSPLHIVPIYVYTYELSDDDGGDQIYSAMNRAMRVHDVAGIDFWRPLIWQIDRALQLLPRHSGRLYRGINVRFSEAEYRTGQTVCPVPCDVGRGGNGEATPARAPAAAADRKQRPDATCEGKNG